MNDYGEGSHAARHEAIVYALERAGYAVVLLGSWKSRRHLGRNISVVPQAVDHSSLLPFCDLYLHNGGTGSTVAALRSGVRSMVVPVWFDQEYWADLLVELNRGSKTRAYGVRGPRQGDVESAMNPPADPILVPFDTSDGLGAACDLVESLPNGQLSY